MELRGMNKNNLLFYKEYEEFYTMAKESVAFKAYCEDAFGQDFSQDGFSDISQIEKLISYIPDRKNVHIHGFDYSEQAIKTAEELYPINAEFRQGVIGEIEYPENSFDFVTSMDTIYFAKDMRVFVSQVKTWLKPDGVFFIGYQEGDVMPKTESFDTMEIVKALEYNQMLYETVDITEQTYIMLKRKRNSALAHQREFTAEGNEKWFHMLMLQTKCSEDDYEDFAKKMSRHIFILRKS